MGHWITDPIEFSHTYCVNEEIDEGVYNTYLRNFTSKDYRIKPGDGFIVYEALDETHDWRINLIRNKAGNFEAERRSPPSTVYDRSEQLV